MSVWDGVTGAILRWFIARWLTADPLTAVSYHWQPLVLGPPMTESGVPAPGVVLHAGRRAGPSATAAAVSATHGLRSPSQHKNGRVAAVKRRNIAQWIRVYRRAVAGIGRVCVFAGRRFCGTTRWVCVVSVTSVCRTGSVKCASYRARAVPMDCGGVWFTHYPGTLSKKVAICRLPARFLEFLHQEL